MEFKKSKHADLERSRGIFFQIGLVIALSLILIAFEWTSEPAPEPIVKMVGNASFEVEEMQITRYEEYKPEPIQQPQVSEILDIVQDDVQIDDNFDFDVEASSETEIKFNSFGDGDYEEFAEEEIFSIVENMPTFNGGDPAITFSKYVFQNLRYPEIAAKNHIGGRVVVQFFINSKGKLVDAVILNPVDPVIDKEAIRVVMSSPPWTPGKQRGKPVKVLYIFPINFVMQ
jgi:protein TonB